MAISFSTVSSQPATLIPLSSAFTGQGKVLPQESAADLLSSKTNSAAEQNLKSQPSQRVPDRETVSDQPQQTVSGNQAPQETQEQRLSQQQVEQVISQLKSRDREVRAHEMAHLSVAGAYARGMSFTYQTGPDGKRYAIGGEVGIDTSAVANNPEATLQKAIVIQNAALAPAEPSAQDMRVASAASQMMMQARAEMARQTTESYGDTAESSEIREADSMQDSDSDSRMETATTILPKAETAQMENRSTPVEAANLAQRSDQLQAARAQFDLRMNLNGA
ncbi:putative metalloprotease CJM1_0395 family protein [Thiomicrorhabdus sp. 6S3-12]|uniref:putative metalloprotease CJM1_0395 family protein n=1 Tax=Thiomicrorhabdus sp. 6S3-12 TaxID=2819681 RepID=UPI001AAC9972|nr:putative metalloprotease CJM1_0395 family protein [Thiomicrorhabdus sp. 6S3-12]MBO1923105.1 hypothetical protein [Thiomicrorhabdus sp. 6S3-12]